MGRSSEGIVKFFIAQQSDICSFCNELKLKGLLPCICVGACLLLNPLQDSFGNFCFSHYMAGGTHFVYRSAVFHLFIFILLCCTIYSSPKLPFKRVDLGLESLAVYRSAAASINLQTSRVTKSKLTTMSVPLGWKEYFSLKNFKLFLASQLVLLSGDVMLNPGPLSNESFTPSERLGFEHESPSYLDSERDGHDSFASQ